MKRRKKEGRFCYSYYIIKKKVKIESDDYITSYPKFEKEFGSCNSKSNIYTKADYHINQQ